MLTALTASCAVLHSNTCLVQRGTTQHRTLAELPRIQLHGIDDESRSLLADMIVVHLRLLA